MNASGEFLVSETSRTLFGLRVCDLGWNAALGLVEGLISLRGNRTTLSFLDERASLRQMLDLSYHHQLDRRLLLPSGGRAFGFVAKVLKKRYAGLRYSAETFVPALLTYLERRCVIGIAGEDMGRLETLREHFARHAPWHELVVIPPDQDVSRRFDAVIVDAASLAAERRVERHLAVIRTGMVVMAGDGLSKFARRKLDMQAVRRQHSHSLPSFA